MINQSVVNLFNKRDEVKNGDVDKIEQQHKKGKLTARERLNVLLDKGSFQEFGLFIEGSKNNFEEKTKHCDGVVIGYGTIFGRPVYVYSQDFSVAGGSVGEMHAKKIVSIQKKALENRIPIIGINDSGGARIQEGVKSLAGYGDIFQQNIISSGVIPQISLIMGPCAGGASYSPALTDFVIMSKNTSFMFITGPNVIKETTGEEVSFEDLGGSLNHSQKTGVADLCFDNDIEVLMQTRILFSYLPLSNTDCSQNEDFSDPVDRKSNVLNTIVPDDKTQPYDIKNVIVNVVDNGCFFEIQKDFAKNIVIGFARIMGRTIGVVANQPKEMSGCIDINASKKASRFVRFCDAFNIPIVSFVDVPGFLPGKEQEQNGIIKNGAKLLYAYGEATVPKITIILRKAYGGAYIVMGSKHLNSDINLAWPNAEIAVLGSKQAGEILFKKHCKTQEEYNEKIKEYENMFLNPYYAASLGYIDDIIEPAKTREYIHRSIEMLLNKKVQKIWKKHDNLPM